MELLKVCEGSEVTVVLCELLYFNFIEAGLVVQDGDMGRRPTIPWSNSVAPFREEGVRKPHLVEKVLLAAIQPSRRNQGAVTE